MTFLLSPKNIINAVRSEGSYLHRFDLD